MSFQVGSLSRLPPASCRGCSGQRLIEIFEYVLNVFDADAEPDCFRGNAGSTLLVRSHLPMRGRSGMAAQRAGVADIDQSFDKLERIVEHLGGLETACDAEGEQRGSPPAEILARERVVRAIAEAGVVNPRDAGVGVQKLCNLTCIFDVALHAE